MGSQKNGLNEMVLLSTQTYVKTYGYNNIHNFKLKSFVYMDITLKKFIYLDICTTFDIISALCEY